MSVAIHLRRTSMFGTTLHPFTRALVARMTTYPTTAARIGAIDTLVRSLVAEGLWAKLDAMYLIAAHDAQAARLNWIADQYNLVAVNSPTFTTDRGYTGNGTSSYLDTLFTPTGGVHFSRDSASVGVWSLTNSAVSRYDFGGGASTSFTLAASRLTGNTFDVNVNNANPAVSGANSDSRGLFSASRTSSSAIKRYINGVSQGSQNSTSSAPVNQKFFIGALNNSGSASSWAARQYAASFIGSGLSDSEMTALYNAIRSYLQTVGAVA